MVLSISLSVLALLSSFLLVFTALVAATGAVEPRVQRRGLRSLNLSPDVDANIVSEESFQSSSSRDFVENPFTLPSIPQHKSVVETVGGNRYSAGYATLPNKDVRMFFYNIKAARNAADAPVILYLTGGPGFSAGIALFKENGPFRLVRNSSISVNEFGLDQIANVVFLDQPIGTGYSYSTSKSLIPTTSEAVTDDLYNFLQMFFYHHHELLANGLHVVAESYAAHYVPALASRLLQQNNQGLKIKLQGVALASAWVSPSLQFASYPDYALQKKLINKMQYDNMTNHVKLCSQQAQNACDGNKNWTACGEANGYCNDILWDYVLKPLNNINFYDVTGKCGVNQSLCYDFSNVEQFMNLAGVKSRLGVDKDIPFVAWSSAVFDAMAGDQMRSFQTDFASLLNGGLPKLLMYGGANDLVCNPLGNLKWAHEMKWKGGFGLRVGCNFADFRVDGQTVGTGKTFGPLSFMTIYNAGHFVAMDQPKPVLEMMKRWIKGQLLK